MEEQNLLREIANDVNTPKNQRRPNTDGLFEKNDCPVCGGVCACGSQQVIIEDQSTKYWCLVV